MIQRCKGYERAKSESWKFEENYYYYSSAYFFSLIVRFMYTYIILN